MRRMMVGKIHRAVVTDSNLNYEGSITIDTALLEAADILPYEMVLVADITNGARVETYAMKGERGSGVICMNGASAHLIQPGDLLTIMAHRLLSEDEARRVKPRVVAVDAQNRIVEKASAHS